STTGASAVGPATSCRSATGSTSEVSLAAVLWRANADLAAAAVAHPFVRGLGDGTLARERFQRYVAQDAYFLESFARAYALGLARCPDRAGIWAFFELLAGVQAELRLHADYAARWGVVRP